jgi:polysaccharide export outer membrane protein
MLKRFIPTFLFLILFVGFSAYAQKTPPVSELTDKQIQELMEHIEARGLSEGEVELMAKARGYSDTDIAIIRERINRKKSGLDSKSTAQPNEISREQIGEVSQRVMKEDRTDTLKVKKIFGEDIFNNSRITFEPNLRVATPPDYILGVDDELTVDISGYAVANYNLKVSPEGTVKVENLAPIYVNGMTVTAAKEKIHQRLSTLFAGLRNGGLKMELTLTKVRTIKVTLVGEVANAGTYSLSSLATVFNALYASGGPGPNGSFRNIQLLRNNKVVNTIDIYDFLLKGAMTGNVSLQDRDVIFIPVASTTIEISGEVRRPYLFEIKPSDSIDDVVKYAGGFSDKAYSAQVKVVRSTGTEKEILSVSKETFSGFLLKNGDKIEVGAILDRFTNKVEVMGAVFRPGEYALTNNPTVSKLLQSAEGLREDAFRTRALIKRLGDNLDPVMVPINLDSVLRGYDVAMKREDVLIIKSIAELRELRHVTVSGRVNIPGEYDYIENMSVNDLIVMAGGLREGGSRQRIEISRRINEPKSSEKNVEILYVDIDEGVSGNFELMPFDIVEVRRLPNYEPQKEVRITGQVVYPGKYSISKQTERISDLIDRVGGLREEAYLPGAQFFRKNKQVAVNIEDVLKNKKGTYNLFLQAGDSLYIPKEMQTVKVSGEVLNPTDVAYQENLSFRDYITQAGGYTDSAFVKKVYVKYSNGHVDKTKTFLTAKLYPRVEKGMEIIVPVKSRQRLSKAEVIAISSGMISVSAVLLTLFRML